MLSTRSWKTTTAGLAAILAALFAALTAERDGDPATVADWNTVAIAAAAGAGLLSARDNNKSSEQVGAK